MTARSASTPHDRLGPVQLTSDLLGQVIRGGDNVPLTYMYYCTTYTVHALHVEANM